MPCSSSTGVPFPGRLGAARRLRPGRPGVARRVRRPRTRRGDRAGCHAAGALPPGTARLVRGARTRPADARRHRGLPRLHPRPRRGLGRWHASSAAWTPVAALDLGAQREGRADDRCPNEMPRRISPNRTPPGGVPHNRVRGTGSTGVMPCPGPRTTRHRRRSPAREPSSRSPSTMPGSSPTDPTALAQRSSTPRRPRRSSSRSSPSPICAASMHPSGAARCTPGTSTARCAPSPDSSSPPARRWPAGKPVAARARLYPAGDARLLHPALLRPETGSDAPTTAAAPHARAAAHARAAPQAGAAARTAPAAARRPTALFPADPTEAARTYPTLRSGESETSPRARAHTTLHPSPFPRQGEREPAWTKETGRFGDNAPFTRKGYRIAAAWPGVSPCNEVIRG